MVHPERTASRSSTEKMLLELLKDDRALLSFVKTLDQVHLDGEGLVDSDIAGLELFLQDVHGAQIDSISANFN